MVREDFAGMRAGMTAGHRAAKAAIKARRADLPVGLSLAMVDDVAGPGGEELRDRKRAEVYEHWLVLAREDDFVGVQNYERIVYGPDGQLPPRPGTIVNGMGTAVEPDSLRGAVEYAYAVSGVPILVSEHGVAPSDDTCAPRSSSRRSWGCSRRWLRVPVLGYCHWTLMDNFEWIFGYGPKLGLHSVDRETFERTPKPSAGVYADTRSRGAGAVTADSCGVPNCGADRRHAGRRMPRPGVSVKPPAGERDGGVRG